jgi:hypothetical protein
MSTYLGWHNGTSAAKVKVLQSLRWSDEGRAHPVRGFLLALAIWRNRRFVYGFRLADMMPYEDAEFVANAYRVLLGREPDAASAALRLSQAQTGRAGRIVVLSALCASPEGRALHASVRGLGFAVLKENLYHGLAAIARRALPPRVRRALLARRRDDTLQPRRSEV